MKVGFISIIGKPNAGKSTLLNQIIKEKVSIVSHHPQTTRDQIRGIYTDDDSQIIFLDTPGIHNSKNNLSNYMIKSIDSSVVGVDGIIYVFAADKKLLPQEIDLIKKYQKLSDNFIFVINKCDVVKKEKVVELINQISKDLQITNIVPISARKNMNVEPIISEIKKVLKEGEPFYSEEYYTDKNERFLISEIIREKTIQLLDDELPYGIAIDIEKIEEGKKLVKIFASIICEKKQHKQIVIGKNGQMIKHISEDSRFEIEKLLDNHVYLDLFVKVKEDWRNSDYLLKEFGYDIKDIEE